MYSTGIYILEHKNVLQKINIHRRGNITNKNRTDRSLIFKMTQPKEKSLILGIMS